jgi:hypothetical protein
MYAKKQNYFPDEVSKKENKVRLRVVRGYLDRRGRR